MPSHFARFVPYGGKSPASLFLCITCFCPLLSISAQAVPACSPAVLLFMDFNLAEKIPAYLDWDPTCL